MPAGAAAMEALGKTPKAEYSNSAALAHPALEPLTDLFALPAWVPFANIFSVGDVLIGLGIVLVMVLAMRGAPTASSPAPGAAALGTATAAAPGVDQIATTPIPEPASR